MIIGSGGAGKSTLATRMYEKLDIPIFHLDLLFWKPNWVSIEKSEWVKVQSKLCSKPKWIIDGNYGGTIDIRLQSADTVIFLNLSNFMCLWRVLKRLFKHMGTNRPDMAIGCNERFDVKFFWWVLGYSFTKKLNALDNKRVIVLSSQKEIDDFINTLQK